MALNEMRRLRNLKRIHKLRRIDLYKCIKSSEICFNLELDILFY